MTAVDDLAVDLASAALEISLSAGRAQHAPRTVSQPSCDNSLGCLEAWFDSRFVSPKIGTLGYAAKPGVRVHRVPTTALAKDLDHPPALERLTRSRQLTAVLVPPIGHGDQNLRMTDQKAEPTRAPAFRTNRLEAFSDAVFAIAITLLVLEIAVPAGAEADLWSAVLHEWPSYLAYIVSFSTVGAVWICHAVITEFLERATPLLIRLNLVLLMVVSFLPFPTRLLAEYIGEDAPERVAATIYGLNLFLAAIVVSLLWRYAVREGLIRSDISDKSVRRITKGLTPGLAGYVIMILLGLFLPLLAVVGYLIIAVYNMIPIRDFPRSKASA